VDEQARDQAFFSALTTEHFVLQSVSSTTVSESSSRASLYLMALSSSLVAIGFAAQAPGAFAPFVAAVLPAVFILGLFTRYGRREHPGAADDRPNPPAVRRPDA
jgi:hypothetical protein